MSDDIADELRGWGNSRENWNAYEFKLGNRAAQHIESLQAELAEARAVIERMKDAVYAHKDNADGNLDSILEAADAAPSSVLDAEPNVLAVVSRQSGKTRRLIDAILDRAIDRKITVRIIGASDDQVKAEALEQTADDIDLPGLLAYERINAEAAAESWLRVRAAVLRDTEGKAE